MYKSLVARQVHQNFDRVNKHDYEAVVRDMTPDVRHHFGGRHALGGQRSDADSVLLWLRRLGRVMPTLQVTLSSVYVRGWPWDITAVARWDVAATLADGQPYSNHGVHIIRLRRGKVVDIDVYEDSQAVAEAMRVQAANGIDEAAEPPIES